MTNSDDKGEQLQWAHGTVRRGTARAIVLYFNNLFAVEEPEDPEVPAETPGYVSVQPKAEVVTTLIGQALQLPQKDGEHISQPTWARARAYARQAAAVEASQQRELEVVDRELLEKVEATI